MTSEAAPVDAAAERKAFLRLLIVAWLAACFISVMIHWQAIINFDMSDPDDHLRLVEVRDWLAGQSWFDVSQHRMNPPIGGDMHWSRLVDVPIAGGILLLTPLLGAHLAETVTLAVVPLLLLGVTMATLGFAVRPLLGTFGGVLTALLVILIPSLVRQLGAMRIDHHGWQITMAAICLAALLLGRGRRSGIAAGIASAVWVQVSAEALPYLAAIGALLGIRYLLSEEERPRFLGYLVTLAAAAATLFAITRPSAEWLAPKCDALSTPFLLTFIAAAVIAAVGAMLPVGRSLAGRAVVLGCAGAGAAACLIGTGLGCAGGPFGSLDPIVYNFWYLNVPEGLPIWRQLGSTAIGTLWTPIVGAVGTWLAWRGAAGREEARHWATIGLLLIAATGVALLVHRAEAVAHLYALPGCGFLLLNLLPRVRALRSAAARVPLTIAVFLLPWPAPAMIAMIKLVDEPEAWAPSSSSGNGNSRSETCTGPGGLSRLAKLPPARILAPIDIGPAILAGTGHSVMAAGYHRNDEAMRDVITVFLGTPERAGAFVQARGIGLVAYCRDLAEIDRYLVGSPDGFMARLERGEAPDWLEPVPLADAPGLRVWRVKPPA
jgi:hypothetical protein